MEHRIDYSFIQKCIQNRICFAAYTLPGETNFSIIFQRSPYPVKFNPDENFTNYKGFILAPFDTVKETKFLIADDFFLAENAENAEAVDFVRNSLAHKKYITDLPFSTPFENYLSQFNNFKSFLDKNKAQKLVLSRVVTTYKKENLSYADIFRALNTQYPASFNYIFYTPYSGLWMGATPEQLLRIEGNEATTVALAGTQKLQEDIHLDKYTWGEKEKHEQQIVVDYIEKIIRKFLPGENPAKHTRTIKAGKAVHLETSFNFNVENIGDRLSEFLSEIHPTPAVCGLPKLAALKFIRETELHDREFYSGFLGLLNIRHKTDLFVNLRCLKAEGSNVSLFVGGGITMGSEVESEWEETSLKAGTLLSLIN